MIHGLEPDLEFELGGGKDGADRERGLQFAGVALVDEAGSDDVLSLGDFTMSVIKAIHNLNDTYMFPARGSDDKSFSGFSKLKSQIDEDSNATGWTLHDLRRTAATHMAALGIAPHVVERLLNHTSGTFAGVAGIYYRFQYLPEMQDAFGKWEAFLIQLIGPDLEIPVNPALREVAS